MNGLLNWSKTEKELPTVISLLPCCVWCFLLVIYYPFFLQLSHLAIHLLTLSIYMYVMRTLGHRVRVLWLRWTNSQGLQKSCGEEGTAWPLSKWDRGPRPHLDRLYCFSGYIKSRMVIIYYAQVHFRWLPFTDNKVNNVANYFKEKDVCKCKGKSDWTGYTPYLRGLTQILGSYFKDTQ